MREGCKQKILFKDIGNHWDACYFSSDLDFIYKTEGNKCTINLLTISRNNRRIYAWSPRVFKSTDGMTFFLVGRDDPNNRDYLHFWIYFLGSPQEVKNYAYTLSGTTGNAGDKFTYYSHVKPLDEGGDNIIAEQTAFTIGTKVIQRSGDENGNWPIEVKIHALKEEAKDTDMESGVSADESE